MRPPYKIASPLVQNFERQLSDSVQNYYIFGVNKLRTAFHLHSPDVQRRTSYKLAPLLHFKASTKTKHNSDESHANWCCFSTDWASDGRTNAAMDCVKFKLWNLSSYIRVREQ